MDDVVIVGGSFAGLTAALQLGRALRKVTVLDTGLPRNRYAAHSHGVFGLDGAPPADLLATARRQLAPYASVKLVKARAESVSGRADDFAILTDDGGTLRTRRLILSYGIVDQFPAVPGFAESWGKSVVHCPYCHGYEIAGQRWGQIYFSPMSLHGTTLYGDWTDRLTLFSDGHDIAGDERQRLAARGVTIVDGKVTAIEQVDGQVRSVITDGQVRTELDALFAHPRIRPSASLHDQLGLETVETPFGIAVKVGERQATSRAGVFAAGDLVSPMHSITIATYTGAMAGVAAQQSMLAA